MFRVNKAKGSWLWVFALLEVSSLLCNKKSFSHRLLQVICGKGGIIWEYQNYRLRVLHCGTALMQWGSLVVES